MPHAPRVWRWSDALGEIADALRRAREGRPTGDSEIVDPPARSRDAPVADLPKASERAALPGPRTRASAARIVEELTSVHPSIALMDEGALDACRSVALRVRAAMARAGAKSFAIVSAARDEGKTTAALNLALAMGTLSKEGEVALVDLDLRRPSVARMAGLDVELGIEQFLLGGAELDDVRVVVRRPSVELYPAAAPVRSTHELLVSPRFAQLIHELESRHAVVIVDTPPDLVASDSALILEQVAMCVPVGRIGFTRLRRFRQLVDSLPRKQVLGGVLNDVRSTGSYDYHYYHDEGSAPTPKRGKRRWGLGGSK
jgi:Mrp family chromosome partitioning ATPase